MSTSRTHTNKEIGLIALAVLGICYTFYVYVIVPTGYPLADFVIYTKAAQTLVAGGNVYQDGYPTEIAPGHTFLLPYLYPPLLAHILSRCLFLSETSLKLAWNLLGFICVAITIATLMTLTADSWWKTLPRIRRALLFGFFVVCFEPLYHGVAYGQVTAIVLASLALFILCAVKGLDGFAGLALALAIHIKMTPILLLIPPLLFGRWRTVLWCLSATAIIAAGTLIDLGSTQVFKDFFGSVSTSLNNPELLEHPFNFSLTHALLEPLGITGNSVAAQCIRVLTIIGSCCAVVVIRGQQGQTYLRSLAFLICVMVLVSPITWYHHLAWIIIPITVATMRVDTTSEDRLRTLTFSLGIYFFLSKAFLLHITLFTTQPELLSLSTIFPALLMGGLLTMIMRQRE